MSPPQWPRITLVTPSFNQGSYIAQTIESVLDQRYPNLEYRVIDGGSRDQSVSVIKRYAKHLDAWVSEPDQGQSDAILKGFANASGEVMNWLNSDDLLKDGALNAVGQSYLSGRFDLIVGEDHSFTQSPESVEAHFVPAAYRFPDCLRFWSGEFRYHQPCTFFSARIYQAVGGLQRHWHYAMDYDLYCRMLTRPDCQVEVLPTVLSAFRLHPDAKTSRAKPGFLREMRAISRGLWPNDWGGAQEAAMDAHSAQLAAHHAAEAWRSGQPVAAMKALAHGLGHSPGALSAYAVQRLMGRRA